MNSEHSDNMEPNAGRLAISDEDFDVVLDACWEQIALFAFENYKEKGRGVVGLERRERSDDILDDHIDLLYAVYEPGCPDLDTARMIEEYDPSWEIVLQYLRPDGRVRTARVRTAPGRRHPWRIYLFERLATEQEEEK